MVGGQWWQQVRSLTLKAGFVISLIHPDLVDIVFRIFVFAQLPVNPPAAVGTIDQIDKALVLAFMIAVVVYGDQVAVFVEDKFMHISQPTGEDFEVGAVRLAADDDALVGVMPFPAFGIGGAHTDIADAVVDPAVRAHGHTRHAVAAETDMNSEAIGEGSDYIGSAVVIGIFSAPGSGSDSEKHFIALVVVQDSPQYVGDFITEVAQEQLGAICPTVTRTVFQHQDLFFLHGQVTPIVGTVFVAVRQPGVVLALLRGQLP